jgi:hypothetical protein
MKFHKIRVISIKITNILDHESLIQLEIDEIKSFCGAARLQKRSKIEIQRQNEGVMSKWLQSLQFIYFSMPYRKQNSIEFHKNKIREEHYFEKKNSNSTNHTYKRKLFFYTVTLH